MLMPRSLLFDQTKHRAYTAKRKELSGAFFKSKLIGMTKIIKAVTLKQLKIVQDSGEKVIDVAKFTATLQAAIIINIAVGQGYSAEKVDWVEADGSASKQSFS